MKVVLPKEFKRVVKEFVRMKEEKRKERYSDLISDVYDKGSY